MSYFQQPFKKSTLNNKIDTFTIRLSDQERAWLDQVKKIIHQEKDSTAIKQLARLGAEVLQDKKTQASLEILLNNYRKNKRLGIVTFD